MQMQGFCTSSVYGSGKLTEPNRGHAQRVKAEGASERQSTGSNSMHSAGRKPPHFGSAASAHHHFCAGERKENVLAKQVVRETKETVEETGARPRAAFQTAKRLGNDQVSKCFIYSAMICICIFMI